MNFFRFFLTAESASHQTCTPRLERRRGRVRSTLCNLWGENRKLVKVIPGIYRSGKTKLFCALKTMPGTIWDDYGSIWKISFFFKIFQNIRKKMKKIDFFFEFQILCPLFLGCTGMYWPSLTVCTGPDALTERRKIGAWADAGSGFGSGVGSVGWLPRVVPTAHQEKPAFGRENSEKNEIRN